MCSVPPTELATGKGFAVMFLILHSSFLQCKVLVTLKSHELHAQYSLDSQPTCIRSPYAKQMFDFMDYEFDTTWNRPKIHTNVV